MDVVRQTIRSYNEIASEYCKKTRQPKFLEWEEEFIIRFLDFITKPNPLILDVGCGDGRHCALIEKNGGKAIGVDLSENMLKEAKALYPEGEFRKMDMRKLNFEDNTFDGIWASGSIYHVPKSKVGEVIGECKRVLKKNGVIGINFKIGKGEGMEKNPRSYSGFPRFFAYYTRDEMKEIFHGFGFEEMDFCKYPEEIFGDDIQQMWLKLIK